MTRILLFVFAVLAAAVVYTRVIRAEGKRATADATSAAAEPAAPALDVPALRARSLSAGLPDRGQWRGKPALADLDGDGHVDLVVSLRRWSSSEPGDGISVYLGNGAGTWQPRLEGLPRDLGYGGADIGDVNGDGPPDIVFAAHDRDPHLFLNALAFEDGAWVAQRIGSSPVDTILADVALGDVEGDGDLDLAVIGQFPRNGGVRVLRNDGDGAFEPWADLLAPSFYGLAVEIRDLDGDGRGEVVAATSLGPKVWRFAASEGDASEGDASEGEEGFVEISEGLPKPPVGGSDMAFALADLDGEGWLELVVAGLGYDDHPALRVYRREGEAWSSWGSGLPDHDHFYDVDVGRFAPDGPPTLVLAGKTGIALVVQTAPGVFALRGCIEGTAGVLNLRTGDVDGDGRDEIACVGFSGVQVLALTEETTR